MQLILADLAEFDSDVMHLVLSHILQGRYQVDQVPVHQVVSEPVSYFNTVQRLQLERFRQVVNYDYFVEVECTRSLPIEVFFFLV